MNKPDRIAWLKACTKRQRDEYYNSVASTGCLICQVSPCLHHCFGHGFPRKKEHRPIIPLCWLHHQGPEGIHAMKTTFQQKHGDQDYLLAKTEAKIE